MTSNPACAARRGACREKRRRACDCRFVHLDRRRKRFRKRQRRGRNHIPTALLRGQPLAPFPWPRCRTLAPGVADLYAGHGALRLQKPGDPGEGIALGVVPDPEAPGRDAAARLRVRHLGEHETCPSDRARGEMLEVPVVGDAVRRGVLAHRRHHDAVAGSHRPERYRTEEVRAGIAHEHAARVFAAGSCGAGWGFLVHVS